MYGTFVKKRNTVQLLHLIHTFGNTALQGKNSNLSWQIGPIRTKLRVVVLLTAQNATNGRVHSTKLKELADRFFQFSLF